MTAKPLKPYVASAVMVLTAGLLASCSGDFSKVPLPGLSGSSDKKVASKKPVAGEIRTKAKFKAGRTYGAASERIVRSAFEPVPRGGGRAVVGKPYKINGRWYKPRRQPNYNKSGIASWYGPNFHGRKTANGEIYDQTALSAAHPTLPLPSYVRVTNENNGRSVIVRVNDRGPFHKTRIIDLSYRTAELLGTRAGGIAKVRVKFIGPAPVDGNDEKYLLSSYKGPGSVEPSKVAARKKLLQYAGLKPDEVDAALRGEIGGEVKVAQAPTTKTRVFPPKPETAKDLRRQAAPTAPTIVANKPVTSAPNVALVSNQGAATSGPVELRPRLLWQPGAAAAVGSTGETGGSQIIKATPGAPSSDRAVDINAYWPQSQGHKAVNALSNFANQADFAFQIKQTILIGDDVERDLAQRYVEKFSRYGVISLSNRAQTPGSLSVTLESQLPFALKMVRKIAPEAVVISQN